MQGDNPIRWQWRHFDLLSAREWHAILALRAAIFVVEQACPYVDPDDKDMQSWHLAGFDGEQLIATMRAVPPGISYDDSSIGRVACDTRYRGRQLGREMMRLGIEFNRTLWGCAIRISGQAYLQDFYHSLGFVTVRGPYQEDDIPHYEMVLEPK